MFDKYDDVAVALEQENLGQPIPPSHVRASTQLKEAKIEFKQIVHVDPDAILFIDPDGRAWTAWTETRVTRVAKGSVVIENETVVFYRQEGFPAFPSPYLKDS